MTIKRALISVSDKTNILEFAQGLQSMKVEILSTGGTAKLLAENGVEVIEVSNHTGFPEMMDGRLKTLHPKIHGGILGRREIDGDAMAEHNIAAIDLVIVNLYPFEQTIAKPDCDLALAIENIDIGGPTMVRAAAKNHKDVAIVVDVNDYAEVLEEMAENDNTLSHASRFSLAVKAFEHTAAYDSTIANYLGSITDGGVSNENRATFPHSFNAQFIKSQDMRYGENPHQKAAFYIEARAQEACVATAAQLQGKALSFNNIADTDAALECVKQFERPACVIVKHANPCGVAVADSLIKAYDRAYKTDPTSAFGGIIAFNRPLDTETARAIIDRQFVEVIIAPSVTEGALATIAEKENVRLLACGEWPLERVVSLDYRRVNGGMLLQTSDAAMVTSDDLKIVTKIAPSDEVMRDLLFSWKVAKFVKSNAIVYSKDLTTVGVGAGQMSRIYSARIAAIKAADADLQVKGSVMASDAFFPFRDGIDAAAEAGITAVIQPGGSMRDQEVIDAANEHGMAMVFTGMRHFRH